MKLASFVKSLLDSTQQKAYRGFDVSHATAFSSEPGQSHGV